VLPPWRRSGRRLISETLTDDAQELDRAVRLSHVVIAPSVGTLATPRPSGRPCHNFCPGSRRSTRVQAESTIVEAQWRARSAWLMLSYNRLVLPRCLNNPCKLESKGAPPVVRREQRYSLSAVRRERALGRCRYCGFSLASSSCIDLRTRAASPASSLMTMMIAVVRGLVSTQVYTTNAFPMFAV
jgi:hypothetical protein